MSHRRLSLRESSVSFVERKATMIQRQTTDEETSLRMETDPDPALIVNPYAPTIAVAENDPGPIGGVLSRKNILWGVMLGVSGAGGLFGFVVVIFAFLAVAATSPATMSQRLLLMVVPGMFAAPIAGLVLAAVTVLVVAPLIMWLFGGMISADGRWTRRQVRLFARLSGLVSGWLSWVALSGFDLSALLIGVLPGAFALFVTPLLIRGLLRKADFGDFTA